MEEGVVVGQPPNDFDGSPFTESRRAKKMCDVCCDVPHLLVAQTSKRTRITVTDAPPIREAAPHPHPCQSQPNNMYFPTLLLRFSGIVCLLSCTSALPLERRRFVSTLTAATLATTSSPTYEVHATAMDPNGLAGKLVQRDPSQLRNKVFNIPPTVQVFPQWMRGTWKVQSMFGGYLFPSKKISRERLTADTSIPGFQKCSIAQMADVGKDKVEYLMKIDPQTGWEDRRFNFQQAIDSYLGYAAVDKVFYDAKKNPNRLSIDFNDYRTINAERIELFCNARESEVYTRDEDGAQIFVHSEYMRQVTFGTGSTYGVPRQVGTNYGLFWTWKRVNENELKGNLLTAAYLDPQDALYFEEPVAPVVVYSNVFTAQRQED